MKSNDQNIKLKQNALELLVVDYIKFDALLSSGLNPLEGPSVLSCRNMELGGAPNFQH